MADQTPDHDQELAALPALLAFRDTAPGAFVPPSVASVEAAGVRRTRRRTAMVAAAVVLAVLGGVGVAFGTGRANTPPAPPAVTPSPAVPSPTAGGPSPSVEPSPSATVTHRLTEIPDSALLTLADVGPGFRQYPDDNQGSGDWVLGFWTQFCHAGTEWPHAGQNIRRDRGFVKGSGANSDAVFEKVELEPEFGSRQMEYWRQWAAKCASSDNLTVTTVDSGFAGDESLLITVVRRTSSEVNSSTHVLVRVGDLVAEIVTLPGGHRAMAAKAAARMCAATGTC
ncbi:hypothetical protein R8Z50_35575 [Longispora sp. K20-0274]|uniref:hypothetical protein n=1 Tax=Longispora sp. K20-0274 TaxID=3088255 RepID=UPI0039999B90